MKTKMIYWSQSQRFSLQLNQKGDCQLHDVNLEGSSKTACVPTRQNSKIY